MKARTEALILRDELLSLAANDSVVPPGYRIPNDTLMELDDRFYAPFKDSKRDEGARKTVDYWRDHGRLTSWLMRNFAVSVGSTHAELYGQVGDIHDADYLAYPHDVQSNVSHQHPISLVRLLMEQKVHPLACLAVLDHAGYIGQGRQFSSRMAAALSSLEDLSTLMATRPLADDKTNLEVAQARGIVLPEIWSLAVGIDVRVWIDPNRSCPNRVLANPELHINNPFRLITKNLFPYNC